MPDTKNYLKKMKITLIRTGGIIPMKKSAETEVEWTDEEIAELVTKISRENKIAGSARDNTSYFLKYNAKTVPIDLDKIPADYKTIFDELKDNLQIVRSL
jgi:hypothetical protein